MTLSFPQSCSLSALSLPPSKLLPSAGRLMTSGRARQGDSNGAAPSAINSGNKRIRQQQMMQQCINPAVTTAYSPAPLLLSPLCLEPAEIWADSCSRPDPSLVKPNKKTSSSSNCIQQQEKGSTLNRVRLDSCEFGLGVFY